VLAGLGLLTLLGFGGIGWWLSAFFHGQDLEAQLGLAHRPWAKQVLDGLLYGGIASANILWLLHNRILAEPRHVFGQLVQRFKLGVPDMVFLSLCAGIGEEWFFRGAIQPWLGIWITAIAFVALHGYLSPGNLGMFRRPLRTLAALFARPGEQQVQNGGLTRRQKNGQPDGGCPLCLG
jgi:membrane protease YdiL (CAAX protease family)